MTVSSNPLDLDPAPEIKPVLGPDLSPPTPASNLDFNSGTDPEAAALAALVLNSSVAIRANKEQTRRRLAEEARIKREREGSYEVQLADETERLLGRMAWVHRHPTISRIFGGSRVSVHSVENRRSPYFERLETDPLVDGDIMHFSGKHQLYSGLVFSSSRALTRMFDPRALHRLDGDDLGEYVKHGLPKPVSNDSELTIFQRIEEMAAPVNAERILYKILTYESRTGKRVIIEGDESREWNLVRQLAMITEFEKEHPWCERLDLKTRARISGGDLKSSHYQGSWAKNQEQEAALKRLFQRLHRSPNDSYPDAMYLRPLTLVRQMNILLGTKTDKK